MKTFLKRWIVLLALFSYEGAIADPNIYTKNAAAPIGAGTGSVTSVAETFTGGLISVAGSPITTSGTLALTVAGTSGGVPYFSGATTWASSGALTANLPVIGGGAGSAPSVGTRSGNTTQFVTTTGTLTSGDCVKIDASGNFVANGSACGGGSGTVTSVGFTGGLISVANPTSTPAFTVAGTSGGIPYFSSSSTWATSALLGASQVVVGGGAGTAPSSSSGLTYDGSTLAVTGKMTLSNAAKSITVPTGGTATNPQLLFGSTAGAIYSDSSNFGVAFSTTTSGADVWMAGSSLRGKSGLIFGWSGNINEAIAGLDTGISRVSAGIVGIGTGGAASIAGGIQLASIGLNAGHIALSATAPTVASGGCTSPTAVTSNGTAAFSVGVGTSCSGSQPLVFTLPAATTGWNCYARNSTNAATSSPAQTSAVSTTSVTITNFNRTTGVAAAWTDADNVVVSCLGY